MQRWERARLTRSTCTRMRSAPASARAMAMAWPMPRVPPVRRAVCPSREKSALVAIAVTVGIVVFTLDENDDNAHSNDQNAELRASLIIFFLYVWPKAREGKENQVRRGEGSLSIVRSSRALDVVLIVWHIHRHNC